MESKKYRWKYKTQTLFNGKSKIEYHYVLCPDCGALVSFNSIERIVTWNYCPYCGSKIVEEEDGTSSI